jgi:hypothetical protein
MLSGVEGDEWLTLPQAAQRLGVSVVTLRRRLKDNQFEAKQVPSRTGPQWMIKLDQGHGMTTRVAVAPHQVGGARTADAADQADEGQTGGVNQADNPAQVSREPLVEALIMIRELQAENRSLAGQLGFIQAQYLQSQAQLSAFEMKIQMLEAPTVERGGGSVASPRPWWRFW